VDSARSAGDWTSLPRLLVRLASIESDAGAWDLAERIAAEAEIGLLQSGEGAFYDDLMIVRLNLAVVRGDVDAARDLAASMEPRTRSSPQPIIQHAPNLALAMLDLWLGDAGAALERLEHLVSEPPLGRLLPMRRESIVALYAEALVSLGRAAESRAIVDVTVRRARRRGPPTALAEVLRGRALVLAAEGDLDGAIRDADEAVEIFAGLQLPFRTARAWFTLGEVRRRSRQKAASRAAFEAALALFEDLGSPLWIERTQTELARVASRRPAGSSLTDTERRVAELAAAGQTNREIAHALFMSVHTVEAHLTRIFRTVGVQSRTELARADLDSDAADLAG
jgi:DNA-binding CsgD family transcriptional regulator